MEKERRVDWMCIGIRKIAETDKFAEYEFFSDVREPDPKFKNRWIVVGQNQGVLTIDKVTGEVSLVKAMLEDNDNKRFHSAGLKIREHWELGEYPKMTSHISG